MSAHICYRNVLCLGSSQPSPVTSSEALPATLTKKPPVSPLFHPPPPPPFSSIHDAHRQLERAHFLMPGFTACLSGSCELCQGGTLLVLFPEVSRGLDMEVLTTYLLNE